MYYQPLRCARPFRIQRYLDLPSHGKPKAFVSEQGRLIFYPMPKAGSSTVKAMLRQLDGLRKGEKLPRYAPDELRTPRYDGYFRFTFVRNPWDRLVSCYCEKVLNRRPERFWKFIEEYPHTRFEKMSFGDFVRFICYVPRDLCNRHFRPQVDMLCEEIGFIGRFERYAEDFTRLVEQGGIDGKFLKLCDTKLNQSFHERGRRHYTDYYDDKLRRLVAEKYKDDIERFDYRFGD